MKALAMNMGGGGGAQVANNRQTIAANSRVTSMATSSKASVLSINVDQVMAPTFDHQCMINNQPLKKKRSAFENITNAPSNGAAAGATSSSSSMADVKASVASWGSSLTGVNKDKKYKSGSVSNVAAVPIAPTASKVRKVDSLSKKTSTLGVKKVDKSKENANSVVPMAAKKPITRSSFKQATSQPLPPPPVASMQPAPAKSKLASSSSMDISQVQILEPQIRFADSTESLDSLGSDALVSSSSASCGDDNVADMSAEDGSLESGPLSADQLLGWEDIDLEDGGDEFTCAAYVTQIFKYYKEREDKFIVDDYMKKQPSLNQQMRVLLVDWMVEVQQQLEFNHEVLYLSVKLLDLYLSKKRIEKEKLQLLGGAAMFIACKFEERMPPIIDDFIFVSDNAYTRNQLIKMEIEILKVVRFDIGVPLSYTFLRRYSKCVRADMQFLTLARYILELSLQDYAFANEKDSLKACAALYLALRMAVSYEDKIRMLHADGLDYIEPAVRSAYLTATEWTPTLIHYTGSFLHDFVHLVPRMNDLVRMAAHSKYKTIYKKYSHQ